jgi:phosphatidylserine/phosphatidylglycerophosphate/cardiolipin synthase-like enzyme
LFLHIKVVCRSSNDDEEVRWVFVGSHNLSMAAWGRLQKQEKQLFLSNYELGVLIQPPSPNHPSISPSSTTPVKTESSRSDVEKGKGKGKEESASSSSSSSSSFPASRSFSSSTVEDDEFEREQQRALKHFLPFELPPTPYSGLRDGDEPYTTLAL